MLAGNGAACFNRLMKKPRLQLDVCSTVFDNPISDLPSPFDCPIRIAIAFHLCRCCKRWQCSLAAARANNL